ncbi:MAG: peptidase M15, partial [Nocardiopsis sp. BM-2018]
MFTLSSASPATAEVRELDTLRVELAQARAEVAALRESATERIREYEEESARLTELTGELEA